MLKYVFISAAIALTATAQSQPATSKIVARSQLATRLWQEIQVSRPADANRVTPDYAETHIKQLRATIAEQMVDALNSDDTPARIKEGLNAVTGGMRRGPDGPTETFAYSADLHGVKAVIIGFNIRYGGAGLGSAKAILQGYRKIGLSYELVVEEEALVDCGLVMAQINSPRQNEIWLLAHGQVSWYMGDMERIQLYTFDGYEFKMLWAAPVSRINPEYKFTGDSITVTSEDRSPEHPPVPPFGYPKIQDTVLLNDGGPVASTHTLPMQ